MKINENEEYTLLKNTMTPIDNELPKKIQEVVAEKSGKHAYKSSRKKVENMPRSRRQKKWKTCL